MQKSIVHNKNEIDLFIVDDIGDKIVPLFCDLCEFIMNNHEDFESYRRFKSCAECEMCFVQPNIKKWKTGWRPSEKDINKYKDKIRGQSLNLFLSEEDN